MMSRMQETIKRTIDILLSLLMLILLAPLMALIALLIKLDSPGPVLFLQERVGRYGKLFRVYKFRTMWGNPHAWSRELTTQAEKGHIIHEIARDPRVTRTGMFLRRTSLDQLPQLFNVLKGDMSLVGPRPEIPFMYEQLHELRPDYLERLVVRPGMTGLWQISGRSYDSMEDVLKLDLYYVRSYSLLLDLKILFQTVVAGLSGRSAY